MWRAWALRTGCSKVDQSMLTYLEGMGTEVVIPHTAVLLRGEVNVLVDTGFGSPQQIAAAYPQELWRTGEQELERLLARLGLVPADIDLVLHTHLHYDHVGNDHLFPGATILAQQADLDFARAPSVPLMRREFFTESCGFPAQFDPGSVMGVDGDRTVAAGLNLLALPGHTPGSQGVVAETADGLLCFAGDLVMVRENLDELTPVGLHTDLEACERSRATVLSLGATVLPSHDMRVFDNDDDIRGLS
jgi:glyoxylase-like metal-dependent hydrolase (beta-lactamase superfamily II)